MDYTQNLHLPQWEADDRIMRTDFNDAMEKIDAAIGEAMALAAGGCKVIAGSYTANGSSSGLSIDLGGQPKAVLVVQQGNYFDCAGLFTPEKPLISRNNGPNRTLARVTSTGFTVYNDSVNGQFSEPYTNYGTTTYLYLAIM